MWPRIEWQITSLLSLLGVPLPYFLSETLTHTPLEVFLLCGTPLPCKPGKGLASKSLCMLLLPCGHIFFLVLSHNPLLKVCSIKQNMFVMSKKFRKYITVMNIHFSKALRNTIAKKLFFYLNVKELEIFLYPFRFFWLIEELNWQKAGKEEKIRIYIHGRDPRELSN